MLITTTYRHAGCCTEHDGVEVTVLTGVQDGAYHPAGAPHCAETSAELRLVSVVRSDGRRLHP